MFMCKFVQRKMVKCGDVVTVCGISGVNIQYVVRDAEDGVYLENIIPIIDVKKTI